MLLIISAIDGCVEPQPKGDSAAAHNLSSLMIRAHAAEWEILSSATIADLVGDLVPLDWVV